MTDLAFSMQRVARRFDHFSLHDIDLTLPEGGVMGLIGPNGAGKSTIIRLLMGLMGADSGRIELLGQAIPNGQVAAKRDIGYVSEDLRLYKNATLAWHMAFVHSIFPQQWDDAYAQKLLQAFDLTKAQKLRGFSHGQRVKAALLLVLARHPRLLILDEPTTGLDPVARREVLNELMPILADERRSVLFSSHNTQDVEQISDVITFIDRGQVVSNDDKEAFLENWRRLRVRSDHPIATTQQIRDVVQMGRTATLAVQGFSDDLKTQLETNGVEVQAIERMSLEEIFVAEVQAKRREAMS